MIDNAHGLYVSLHQLSAFTDMLEALERDAEAKHDYRLFGHLSRGYIQKIRALNGEIKAYLRREEAASPASSSSMT